MIEQSNYMIRLLIKSKVNWCYSIVSSYVKYDHDSDIERTWIQWDLDTVNILYILHVLDNLLIDLFTCTHSGADPVFSIRVARVRCVLARVGRIFKVFCLWYL